MKKQYLKPDMAIEGFCTTDVITVSSILYINIPINKDSENGLDKYDMDELLNK